MPCLPDSVHVMTDDTRPHAAVEVTEGVWTVRGAQVIAERTADGLRVRVHAGAEGLSRIVLRWRVDSPEDARILGDAWERGYGDLQWRTLQPDRPLPWYVLITGGAFGGPTTGWGVRTRAGALCSWTVDEGGIALWADVRSGGLPVLLGERELDVATVVTAAGPTPFTAHEALCTAMSPDQLPSIGPVVGCNNWYYAYGRDFGPDAVLRDARTVVEYADGHPVRPYCVIDDGWTEGGGSAPGGPWDTGLPGVFDDMAELAARVADTGARPGLWFRPLLSRTETGAVRPGMLRDSGFPLDPSLDVALDTVAEDVTRFRNWGYELIKHDFSTYDVFGHFAAHSPAELASPGWSLADRTRTNAEILVRLYRTIAGAAGDTVVIGCNTVGHLAAGLVRVQRCGDDTSGRSWERTRRMGVNTLAFRLAQHNRLFTLDADCVPCTPQTDWNLNRQFLDLVARSGTALFVSVDPAARTDRTDADLAAAVGLALDGGTPGGVEPLDWLSTTAPRRWRSGPETLVYDWAEPWGATPLPV